jgi:hypothetical protein
VDESAAEFVSLAKLAGIADSEFRAPDLAGTEEGWRAWKVNVEPPPFGTCPKLFSATRSSFFWAPRQKARAECKRCKEIPGQSCSCGFYSAKTLTHLREMGYQRYQVGAPVCTVVGRLACWGKVIEGTQGWRSEFAYPVRLYVPFEAWKLGSPLAEGYGVPVRLLNLLDPKSMPPDEDLLG